MRKELSAVALTTTLLSTIAFTGSANAAIVAAASLFEPLPPVGTTTTVVGIQNVTPPSQATYTGNGYTITFDVAANQGIVHGSVPSNTHAIPVAGVTLTGQPTYLTGDFGSSQTTDQAQSGNFLSTGTGTITISFTTPQHSLALLWGSIDKSNEITFNDGTSVDNTLTGATVQTLAAGFTKNGYQGPAGSAYVVAVDSNPFSSVTFTSGVVSFEFAAVAASIGNFTSPVPLPSSAPMFGAALLALGAVGYGVKRKKAAPAA